MSGLLQRTLRRLRGRALDYETAKQLSASPDRAKRLTAARQTAEQPEILYYLAHDPAPEVRAAVAANDATPVQADLILAKDADEAVRCDLAAKIARVAPGLTAAEQDRLRQLTYQALEMLVRDNVPRVRRIIAETLKDVADAPPEIIGRLARDCEIAVSSPVLQFSPVLSETDLLDIIAHLPNEGALGAIARRRRVPGPVADAIGASGDLEAIRALLANKSAQIREETLDRLIERAPEVTAWHAPLVARPVLSAGAVLKLATFVAANLLDALGRRHDLDPATARQVGAVVMRRLAEEAGPGAGDGGAERAQRLHAAGKLDDEAFGEAAVRGDRALIRAGLALRARLPAESVDKVLGAQSAKGIVALCWKAGLTMATAVRLQRQVCRLTGPAVLQARPDGGWPLSPEAMAWQVDFISGL